MGWRFETNRGWQENREIEIKPRRPRRSREQIAGAALFQFPEVAIQAVRESDVPTYANSEIDTSRLQWGFRTS
jgi:hypothetical protein